MISIAQVIIFILTLLVNDTTVSQNVKIDALNSIQSAIEVDLNTLGTITQVPVIEPKVEAPTSPVISDNTNNTMASPIVKESVKGFTLKNSSAMKSTNMKITGEGFTQNVSVNIKLKNVEGTILNDLTLTPTSTTDTMFNVTLPDGLVSGTYDFLVSDNGNIVNGGDQDINHFTLSDY
jgi:hypothetical protein